MSSRYEIRPACLDDSPGLLRLIEQTPQEGEVHLNFERSPDFFHATSVTTTEPDVWVMIDHKTDTLLASFSIGKREVYVDGRKRLTRYGNDLRIHEDYRGGRTLLRLFKQYRELMEDEWMQTVILSDNKASINSVGSGRLSLPTYYEAGQFRTYMVDLCKKQHKPVNLVVRRAFESDRTQMQNFFDLNAPTKQFYPCYDFSLIGTRDPYYRGIQIENFFLAFEDGQLVGMTAVWDQKAFKQTRFVSYHGKMKVLRHLNNLKSQLFGGLQLPEPGSIANYLSLHTTLCKENRVDIFQDLLSSVLKLYYASDYEALIFGFDTNDPLNEPCQGLKAYQLLSNHYLASYQSDPADTMQNRDLFYLEPTRL